MTDVGFPNIDPDFATWHREISIAEDREQLLRRWKGACSLANASTGDDLDAMVRIVFRARTGPPEQQRNRIVEILRKSDELFPLSDNSRELEVLCGTALVQLARSDLPLAAIAALCVLTTSCDGMRKIRISVPLAALCERAIAQLAESNRKRPSITAANAAVSFEAASKKVAAQYDVNGVAAAFQLAGEASQRAISGLVAAQATAFSLLRVQDEELQMLWWLIGERSTSLNCSFSSVLAEARPLVLGAELASMTVVAPGPTNIEPLLHRAGVKSTKKSTIVDAVNNCPAEWLTRAIEGREVSELTTPIHLAIKRRLETNDDGSWVAGWSSVSQIASDEARPGLSLGQQFYRECILRTFWVST